MAKKTYNEKLNFSGDLPKVEKYTDPRMIEKYKTDSMVIATPLEYDKLMKKVPAGKLTTIDRMMALMAKKHSAGRACPMTAGIFVNIYADEKSLPRQAGNPVFERAVVQLVYGVAGV